MVKTLLTVCLSRHSKTRSPPGLGAFSAGQENPIGRADARLGPPDPRSRVGTLAEDGSSCRAEKIPPPGGLRFSAASFFSAFFTD